jgi:predicted dehydrogenase
VASKRTPRPCACGATYGEHRLGMSFADARRMLWNVEDPNRPGWWRQKRRHSVLGLMRELKIHSFYAIHHYCEMEAAA